MSWFRALARSPRKNKTAARRSFLRGKHPRQTSRTLAMESLERREVLTHGFFQGFEVDSSGWNVFGGTFNAARVASGTGGITSLTGSFHGSSAGVFMNGNGAATPFGPSTAAGYTVAFPPGGYTTSVSIYLDINNAGAYANDTRFDWSSAINNAAGSHRRDFVFNGGFYNSADMTGPGAGTDRFVISASTNATRSGSFPKNPGRAPIAISTEGWYTFQHRFYDGGGGQLYVDLTIKDAGGATINTWTLTDATDIIGATVGGNRYGWLVTNEFTSLAIDDSYQLNNALPPITYVDDNWTAVPFGADPDGAGPATFFGYDAFATVQDGIDGVANSGSVMVHSGTYAEDIDLTTKPNVQLLSISGASTTSIVGVLGGNNETVRIGNNQVIDGFTITRALGGGENNIGLVVYTGHTGAVIRNNIFTGNRTAIYLNGGNSQATITRNVIDDNRTGLIFPDGTGYGAYSITENFITNNRTFGVLFDAVSAIHPALTIFNNNISGNFAVQLENNSGQAINASGNWWGSAAPVVTAAKINGTLPPAFAYPGPAVPPGFPYPYDITGSSATLVDYTPWLNFSTDTSATPGFQGDFSHLHVDDNSHQTGADTRINEGILVLQNGSLTGGNRIVQVHAGTYAENVVANKSLQLLGPQAGVDADARFAAFLGGPANPKANPNVEAVITAPVSNPTGGNPGANDLVRMLADDITVDGLVIDGNNPLLGVSGTTIGGVNIHARRGITNLDSTNTVFDTDNLQIQNNILQNFGQRGISLSSNGVVLGGNDIADNVIRSFVDQGVILFGNAYADITGNTIDAPQDSIGLHLQNFHSAPSSMTWSGNMITVRQDAFGIHANLFYAMGGLLNVTGNTINAAPGVTGTSDFTWGLNLWSIQNGATVNASNNTIGSAGGEFARGINLWNLPTATTVTVSGGSVGNSVVGINLDNVDPFFGGGADTTVNVQNVAVTANSIGMRVRAATLPVAPLFAANTVAGDVRVNLTGGTFTAGAPGATGIQVLDGIPADGNSASLQVLGSPSVSGGTTGLAVSGAETAIVGNTLGTMSFSGQSGKYIALSSGALDNVEINGTAVLFDGQTGGVRSTADNYTLEDRITHGVDDSSLGFVRVAAGKLFTTPNSFVAPAMAADIQDAIDVASNGNTLHIQGGSYTGSANVSPVDLTLSLGASPAQVVINGPLTLDGGDVLVMELNGTNAATDYDNFVVNGAVSLGNNVDGFATLSATAGFAYAPLQYVKLIDNNLAGLTGGHFDGLMDGSIVTISGQDFLVYHNGGSGNDVILVKTFTPFAPPVTYAEDTAWTNFTLGTFVDGDLSTGGVEPAFIGYNAFNNRPVTLPNSVTPVQDAVNAVLAGGTVIVNDGSYPENVTVTKNLTLDGQPVGLGSANITGAGAGTRLTIGDPATTVVVSDMTLSGAGPALSASMTAPGSVLTLEDLTTSGAASGGTINDVATVNFLTGDTENDTVVVTGTSLAETGQVLAIAHNLVDVLNIETRGGSDFIDAQPGVGPAQPLINLSGGLPNVAQPPVGDTLGMDKLKLDMSVAATGPVVVATIPGVATSPSTKTLTFTQIEDIDLCDPAMTDVEMGDLYIRGTSGVDNISFTGLADPNVARVRVNNTQAYYTVTRRAVVYGRGGNDYIQMGTFNKVANFYGEDGDDYLTGYHQNDKLVGGRGKDRINGGNGNNVIWGDRDPVEAGLTDDAATRAMLASQQFNAGVHFQMGLTEAMYADTISTGAGMDEIYAGPGADQVGSGDGDDYIFGGYGNDNLIAQSGNDRVYGGAGNDTLVGDLGDDLLEGNAGNDQLYGKAGHDVLIGGDGLDALLGGDGNDVMFGGFASTATYDGIGDTSHQKNDANDAAMLALLQDWNGTGAGGAAFNLAITGVGHVNDGDVDTLQGDAGNDKFLLHSGDKKKGFKTGTDNSTLP